MKTRIVLWGENPENQKILVAIGLRAKENKIDIYTIPEQDATELLYNQLMNQWRVGENIPLPESHVHQERLLTVSESLLPEDIKIERSDIIHRAQTEWHFVVLSSKLYDSYINEIEELRERIEGLDRFEENIWEELKTFWSKVQTQIHDKNLFRDHSRRLKELTNGLFGKLKDLRRALDNEFKQQSTNFANTFYDQLEVIEKRIEKGLGLQPIFEELKDLQREYRDSNLTREDRRKVWNRLDKAFKTIKEKRYGPGYKKEFSPLERINRRYDGLNSAIDKMKKSIYRDERDMDFQDRRIEQSEGQLESQIRQAKMKMIAERIKSKEEKLNEMLKTKEELESRIAKEKVREDKRKEKMKLEEAKKAVKEKIADEIRQTVEEHEFESDKLQAAAIAITGKPGEEDVQEVQQSNQEDAGKKDSPPEEKADAGGDTGAEEPDQEVEQSNQEDTAKVDSSPEEKADSDGDTGAEEPIQEVEQSNQEDIAKEISTPDEKSENGGDSGMEEPDQEVEQSNQEDIAKKISPPEEKVDAGGEDGTEKPVEEPAPPEAHTVVDETPSETTASDVQIESKPEADEPIEEAPVIPDSEISESAQAELSTEATEPDESVKEIVSETLQEASEESTSDLPLADIPEAQQAESIDKVQTKIAEVIEEELASIESDEEGDSGKIGERTDHDVSEDDVISGVSNEEE